MFGFGESTTDAIAMLKDDHRTVEGLFKEFEAAEDKRRKQALALKICDELTVHATLEEEIFYPEAMVALQRRDQEDAGLVWEATVEHGTLEGLIASIRNASPPDESFDATVKVLKEYVQHHVKEEENTLFPKVRATDLDLEDLGVAIATRKEQMVSQPPSGMRGKPRRGDSETRRGSQRPRSSNQAKRRRSA